MNYDVYETLPDGRRNLIASSMSLSEASEVPVTWAREIVSTELREQDEARDLATMILEMIGNGEVLGADFAYAAFKLAEIVAATAPVSDSPGHGGVTP